MCRLYGFRATHATKVECTLVHAQNALLIQSQKDARGLTHADGWGIACYRNGELEIESRQTPAFEDLHFSAAAERLYGTTVVAHVRRATVGGVSLANTHPFRHGRWIFGHNGTLAGFSALREELLREIDGSLAGHIRGTTDSETMFYWLLSRLSKRNKLNLDGKPDCATLGRVLAEALVELVQRSEASPQERQTRLNFLLTNGQLMAATRWNHTLFWVERDGIRDCEICGIPHVDQTPKSHYRAVIVASEPISDEAWQEVANGSVLTIDEDLEVRTIQTGKII